MYPPIIPTAIMLKKNSAFLLDITVSVHPVRPSVPVIKGLARKANNSHKGKVAITNELRAICTNGLLIKVSI